MSPESDRCPVCDNPVTKKAIRGRTAHQVKCRRCGEYIVSWFLRRWPANWTDVAHLISGYIRSENQKGNVPEIPSHIEEEIRDLIPPPITIQDKIDRIVTYIAMNSPSFGKKVTINSFFDYPITVSQDQDELNFIIRAMVKRGLLEKDRQSAQKIEQDDAGIIQTQMYELILTEDGWKRFEEIAGRSEDKDHNSLSEHPSGPVSEEERTEAIASVFLAHSSKDKPFVRKLARELELHGIRVWLDESELKVGDSIIRKISEAVHDVDYVVAVVSPNSITSKWVRKELEMAIDREVKGKDPVVLPILRGRLKEDDIPTYLTEKLYADFRPPREFQASLLLLLKSLGVQTQQSPRSSEDLDEALRAAARRGNITAVNAHLKSGADVNARGSKGHTALMWAAIKGHTGTAKVLLAAGANIHIADDSGKTALILAAENGHTETVQTIIIADAYVDARDDDGTTALMLAARNGHLEMVKLLGSAAAHLNAKDSYGRTALMWAAWRGRTETVQTLLAMGAHVNYRTNGGRTALSLARLEGHIETAGILKQAGAKE